MARPPRFKHAIKQIRAADPRLETWIQGNFYDLNEAYPTGRLNLRELSQVVQAAGLTNTHGGRLSDAAISKTWSRVRRRILTAQPLHPLKPSEIAPGVIVLPVHEGRTPPALEAAAIHARPSAPLTTERFPWSAPDSGAPSARRLTADEKLARIVERTYASHPQMPKPVK